jgi:phage tail sheath gpL-like
MALPNLLNLNFLVPYVAGKLDFSRAIRGLRGMPRRLLLVGHKLASGAAAANTMMTISTEADAVFQFGEGSMLVQMWRSAKANVDLGVPMDCISIAPNGTAVAASSIIVVTNAGNLSMPGEVMLYIGGVRISIGVTTADTQITVAARLIAAINANAALPVTAAATANTNEVKLTARWGGLTGNDIDVRGTYYPDDRLPNGLTLTIPAMAGGSTSPDLTPLIAAMAWYRATELVVPFMDSTNMAILEAELATRWLQNNMQDGQVINAMRGTEATITTWLNTRNSPHVHTIATTKDCTNPWETASMAGAAIESMAAIDPAQPHTGVPLLGSKGPKQGDHWTIDQLNNLLLAGASPLDVQPDYTATLLRMVSNYTMTAGGAADRSMASVNWLKTMSYYRWFVVTEFEIKYRGFKIAEYVDEPIPGQKIMTKDLGEEIMLGLYIQLMAAGLVQNKQYYQETLVVEVDGPNGKLKIQDEPVIITQHYQTEVTSSVVAGHV